GTGTNDGTYPATVDCAQSTNYNAASGLAAGDFVINRIAATWTTNPNSKFYGNSDPNPITTGSGTFLAGDNITATYGRAPGSNVGTHHITALLNDPDGK